MSESDSTMIEEEKEDKSLILYKNLLQDIKGMNVLSSYQLYYLRELSKHKLLEIIELYNLVMRNVNEIL
jgi:hypothetical protein